MYFAAKYFALRKQTGKFYDILCVWGMKTAIAQSARWKRKHRKSANRNDMHYQDRAIALVDFS
ncbi:hypothetical protein NIES4074_54490 [Cylindrospermum sp. NIES-4074]|nr:hypothetical protein NIES4074_54490 [Cylindrospermum sp. NIES-4074]